MPWDAPLLPQSAIQPAQDWLTQPKLDQSPTMARIKGFGAGALDGLRGLTKPSSLAGMGAMMLPGVGEAGAIAKVAPEAIQGLSKAIPAASEASSYFGPVSETLGEMSPEFTAQGGEGLYNVGRGAVQKAGDMAETAYHNIMQGPKGWAGTYRSLMAPTAAETSAASSGTPIAAQELAHPGAQRMMHQMYEEANPIFRRLQDAGMFAGKR